MNQDKMHLINKIFNNETIRTIWDKEDEMMNVIKFNLDDLEKQETGFSYYLLGRSYDLEENDATQDYNKALEYYLKGLNIDYPLCTYSLGISYELGLGELLEIDKNKAKDLLNRTYPKIIELINNPDISNV